MKYLLFLIFSFLLFACTNNKSVYWCGEYACINNKEKEAYFKKTMIVEVRNLSKQDKKSKSELEIIKKQAGLEDKKKVEKAKEFTEQARLEEKRRIEEEKELAKQVRLEEKRGIEEEKELTKQVLRKEKKIVKRKKKSSKKNILKEEKVIFDEGIVSLNVPSPKFKELVEKIYKKNLFKSYPNINDIPN